MNPKNRYHSHSIPQEDLFECISSGTFAQNDSERFGAYSRNNQCVCMSVCAGAVAQNITRSFFTPEQIDQIITYGDAYYLETKQTLGPNHRHAYLNADEVNQTLTCFGASFNISTSWAAGGFYAKKGESISVTIAILVEKLEEIFSTHPPPATFIFNGLGYAVSFWSNGDHFLLFNSHAVSETNQCSGNGVGRLFSCRSIKGLASLLLVNASAASNSTVPLGYEISLVTTCPIEAQASRNVDDPKLNMTPVVILKDIFNTTDNRSHVSPVALSSTFQNSVSTNSIAISTPKKKKVGRPTKRRPGRPKASGLTIEEQHRIAVKKYTDTHPDVNRTAVKRYTDAHPEKHRKSAKRFSDDNPKTSQKSTKKFHDSNPGRHLPAPLRKGGLIAEYSSEQLSKIKEYKLKNPSLRSNKCYRCPKCGAPLFEEERGRKMWCCGKGRYNILSLKSLPKQIYLNENFVKDCRLYNDMFAFSALQVPSRFLHPNTIRSFIKIQGRVYHQVCNLSCQCENPHKTSLYIDDGQERIRRAEDKKLDVNLIKQIQNFLQPINPYIKLLKQLKEFPSENARLVFEKTTRRTHGPVLGDQPQGREVAALITSDMTPSTEKKLTIWKLESQKPDEIDVLHPLVEPFQYPLLYPYGTAGWHVNRKDNTKQKLSQLKYIRCLLLSEDRFSKFGRLSETWLVDMYVRIEHERLRFFQESQKKAPIGGPRIAPVDELMDTLNRQKNLDKRPPTPPAPLREVIEDETVQGDGPIVPGRIYLPHTFTGGPRYMQTMYLDAMGIVSSLGGPSYFLTFTTFGGWEEITKSRHPTNKTGEPDVIDRVFHIKLQELLKDLKCGKFFGKLTYIVWVIEFQMRGLPHAHICFRVEGGGPIQNYEIDKVISAEIPDQTIAGGRLHALVEKFMIHGPCGPNSAKKFPCWDEKRRSCSKFFPKSPNPTTFTDERGFVHYKRSCLNRAKVGSVKHPVEVDDRWVIPYNPALLLKYNCHINLEISSTRRVVKYLFKYISKGSPMCRVSVVTEPEKVDEVKEFVQNRYVGSSDAAWRILEFHVTGRNPTVIALPVHLKGKETVFFHPHKEHEVISKATSKLIIYFNRPQVPEMEDLTYQQFYENFHVHSNNPTSTKFNVYPHSDGVHFVTPRQRGDCIARLYWVSPTRGEQYFLRVLLSKYPCRSYEDLYRLGGRDCATFQQAAKFLGLADDHQEYIEALREATKFMTADRLRQFFVLLSTIGAPAAEMWEEFKNSLCEDFIDRLPGDHEMAIKYSLIHIDRCLRRHGSSLFEAGLPVVHDDSTELGREKLQYSASLQKAFLDEWEPRLSPDQLQPLQYVKQLINGNNRGLPRALFIDGPGGYGKTQLLKVIAAFVRSESRICLSVATSGIAALNLVGGFTAHSMFRLPLKITDGTGYWFITNGSQRAELIRAATTIIFDEAPMANKNLLEMIDRSLQDLMQNSKLFGGKIIIFSGDFRQIPPIHETSNSPADVIEISPLRSRIWNHLKFFPLTVPQRTSGDEQYSKFLLDVGANFLPRRVVRVGNDLETLIGIKLVIPVKSLDSLIDFVFPAEILSNPDECAKRAILSTHNINVKEINNLILEALAGDSHELYSLDTLAETESTQLNIDVAMLHHAHGKGVPDHRLKLKVGAVCMITRNLNFDMGLVNGSKVIICAISRRLITVRKPGTSELFGIPRISFKFPIYPKSPIEMLRRQFPLQPCFAISVHKSQGQTIEVAGVDLRSDCFAHGQLYVALSRVKSSENIRVLVPAHRVIDGVAYTKNIVFTELLQFSMPQ